jgi:hypothetical protein
MDDKVKTADQPHHISNVFDLRFFDVQTYSTPIIFYMHLRHPHQKFLHLIHELDCYRIHSERLLSETLISDKYI